MIENTLPTMPGAILGYRKNGQPIRVQAGGAPDDEPSGGQPQESPSAEVTPEVTTESDAGRPDPKKVDDLPEWAKKLIKDTRAEAADFRTKLKDAQKAAEESAATTGPTPEEVTARAQAEFAQKIGKALGLISEEEQPLDPQQVIDQLSSEKDQTAKERDQEKERHRRALIELAVHRGSTKVGADPDALLDSRSFLKVVRDLDPDGADFSTQLTDAIQLAVENNPKFKAATQAGPPARSGGEFTGGPGGRPNDAESKSVDDFRAQFKKRSSSR
ncbi:hypothetical protein [Streptosporangium sp. NPDC001681]|uniref:hypothetical protein n=1 Tax=Streptosporangium sp. NPDC001681 TaxID=3154395 RepID=UPI00332F1998